ncbi:MAG: patatin-like phospholipase family protein [Planctomycetota bacterium]
MNLLDRLKTKGPKRILSLDGGGIRGLLALGFLERIETILRERYGRPDLLLRDYFDLIGGTSTGAIIAACLSIGQGAAEVRERYLRLGGKVFGSFKWKQWQARFDERPLAAELKAIFGDRTLGDESITTGLCIIVKRGDTGSTWPLFNHPEGRFFAENREILVRDALRASTAAPVYFMPKKITLRRNETCTFVDGGVSMANNPALQLFLLATLQGFPLRWPTGADCLMLVSLGSGSWYTREDPDRLAKARIWDWAARVPMQLMADASMQNQLLLQYLSHSPTACRIDAEVGDLSDDLLGAQPALHYLRYDVLLEPEAMEELGFAPEQAEKLRSMSAAENRFDLAALSQAAAKRVHVEHFPAVFDLRFD